MTTTYLEHIDHPAAWRGEDFSSIDDVSFVLRPRHIDALDAALRSVRAAGLDLNSVERMIAPAEALGRPSQGRLKFLVSQLQKDKQLNKDLEE